MDTTLLFVISIEFILITSIILMALFMPDPETVVASTEDEETLLDNPYLEYTLIGF